MKNYKYILTHSSGNLTLEYNPIDWESLNLIFKRSDTYHSILRSQYNEVEFPFDGKDYIDTIYASYGIDTDIGCEIQYLNKQTSGYVTLYEGIIDLSEWVSRRDTSTVKIIDSSVMAKFVARDEVAVPINRTEDLDGNTLSVWSYLDRFKIEGVEIYQQIYLTFDGSETTIVSGYTDTDEDEPTIEEVEWDAVNRAYVNNSGSDEKVEYNVGCTLSWDLTGTGFVNMRVRFDRNGTSEDIVAFNNQINSGTGSASGTLSNTVTIPDNGYLGKMYIEIVASAPYTGTVTVSSGTLQMFKIIDGTALTEPQLPLLHEVGAKILEVITGVDDPLNCSLIGRTDSQPRTYTSDGDYSLTALASGNLLRGYSYVKMPLTTSFRDYFKSLDALFNLGCWYDGSEFIISDKADFYGTNNIITLDEVQDLEISISQEHYFNKIMAGYKDPLDYEEVNGGQNFNVTVEYVNDGKRINNILDIQSIYHGDDYGIELARKAGSKTSYSEDTRYDDQIFFLWGKRTGGDYITVPGSDIDDIVEGVYAPDTRLNLDITPKRNLIRHYNHIGVPLFITEGTTSYLSKQFELDLISQKAHEAQVDEIGDIDYSDLEEPLFYPELYNFKAPLTNAHILQLQSDPHGYVEFDYIGTTYRGYILEVSAQPFMRQGNWTLIKCNPNRL